MARFAGTAVLRAALALCVAALATAGAAAGPSDPGATSDRRPPSAGDGRRARATAEPAGEAGPGAALRACLEGSHRPACRSGRMTADERERLRAAEARQNVLLCLAGTYAYACRHELLSPAESRAVADAEARADARRTATRPAAWAATGRFPVDPYAEPGSPRAPAGVLDGDAIGAPLQRDPRAGPPLARSIPDDVREPDVGPRWPRGATDPAAMYGTPFRRDSATSPYGTGGSVVLSPP